MSDLDPALIEQAAQALVTHSRIPKYDGSGQTCAGCNHLDGEPDGPNSPRHMAHAARVVLEAVAPAIAAQALRDAAEHTSDARCGYTNPRIRSVHAVTKWLRERADQLEKEDR